MFGIQILFDIINWHYAANGPILPFEYRTSPVLRSPVFKEFFSLFQIGHADVLHVELCFKRFHGLRHFPDFASHCQEPFFWKFNLKEKKKLGLS